jgi:hypothetical protein
MPRPVLTILHCPFPRIPIGFNNISLFPKRTLTVYSRALWTETMFSSNFHIPSMLQLQRFNVSTTASPVLPCYEPNCGVQDTLNIASKIHISTIQ